MQIGSIVTLKAGIQFPAGFIIKAALLSNIDRFPVHGETLVVEAMDERFCRNCNKVHHYIGIDGVGDPIPIWDQEWFEELQPPQEVSLEKILEEPVTA